ncbi:cytochrome c oxidase cbb3-type subunit 4 [Gemmobacter caeni]|uniref:Cytochrome c oxidase cbb3-type subunit 4 n=1 Tax=Gemmobacter caeni TaxID=589035 RepID=A0A2T6ANT4_9RHOB|nr:cbb3-type cytochrome c oxidase subunit 3 [Gemmobacter caeni]PTX45457.1 cytochrome c oxidase cbb3-type subunit 4 [Gemmobacter caeni]TWI93628.1 cytochrome c oxidase cbb3-type subunit 4 [Gemmobacter caeni]
MDVYSLLRHFADSWMLLFMTLVFVGVVFYAFRPGSRKAQNEAAMSIFRNERRPAASGAEPDASKLKEA